MGDCPYQDNRLRTRGDDGEVSSWLILAAGLALAAVAAAPALFAIVSGLTEEVADAAGVEIQIEAPPEGPASTTSGSSVSPPIEVVPPVLFPGAGPAPGSTPGTTTGPPSDPSSPPLTGPPSPGTTTPPPPTTGTPPAPGTTTGTPPAPAGPPSDTVDEVLADVIEAVDNGDDLGISESELDDIHDWLASLTDEELAYVIANLSDEQLERIFHNAHSSGILSDDWNDRERREFYDNLGRLSQEERNRIAEILSDADDIDEGAYLAILQGLQVDVSLGDKPDGAEIDVIIQGAIDPNYLDGPISDGDIADGRVITVNDDDYERAWREQIKDRSRDRTCDDPGPQCDSPYESAEKTFLGSRGFVDSEGRLWVQDSGSETPGTAVHEAVHGYSDGALGSTAESLNEGVTEYFTQQALATIDDPTTPEDEAAEAIAERNYDENLDFTEKLVDVVGEEAVAAAFFDGDMDALEEAYIAATGRDSDDFDDMMEIVDERRPKPDWSAAKDLLDSVSP